MTAAGQFLSTRVLALGHRIARRWTRFSFKMQMALSGGLVLILAALACGGATMAIVTENVVERETAATAMMINGMLSDPLRRHLQGEADAEAEINAIIDRAGLERRFPHFDLWLSSGVITYSNSSEMIGRQFPLPAGAREAFDGNVVGLFTELGAPENRSRNFEVDYIEIYAPIYDEQGEQILGIVEVHEHTRELESALLWSTLAVWATVMATALVVAVLLHRIVVWGSDTIESQKRALSDRLRESEVLSARYREANELAQLGARTFTEISDRALRRISADIHDGPLQLLSLAALKIELARKQAARSRSLPLIEETEGLLRGGIGELRDLAQGIVLPELEQSSVREVVELALARHIARTRAGISAEISVGTYTAAYAVNICVFRFIQEGLSNAYWHGTPGTTRLVARLRRRRLDLRISNGVSASHVPPRSGNGPRALGIAGQRARTYALGGQFSFEKTETEASMTMSLNLDRRALTASMTDLEAGGLTRI